MKNNKKNNKIARIATLFFTLLLSLSSMITVKAQPLSGQGVDPNALWLMDFEDGSIAGWTTNNINRGEKQSVELMDAEKGDPVRFGRYAVKINWDWTAGETGNTLASLFSPPGTAFTIPAMPNPKKIGMWIYASPECKGNVWFRLQLFTPPGSTPGKEATVISAFVNEPRYDGINWEGWKYHEFTFPTTGNTGHNVAMGPPSTTTPSFGMFRLIQETAGTSGRELTSGYFIIDNIRVTTAAEDMTPPTISTLTGNGTALPASNGPSITTSLIDLSSTLSDAGGSGINFSNIQIMVDGYIFKADDAGFSVSQTNANAGSVSLNGLNLGNGQHTVVVQVEDNFGHTTTKTGVFTVNASDGTNTTVTLATDAQVQVGNPFEIKINTNNLKDVKELEFTLAITGTGSVDATGGVEFASSAQATSTYTFNTRNGNLSINLKNDVDAAETGEGTLATIKVNIPPNCNPTDVFRCSPVSAKAIYADDSQSPFSLFTAFTKSVVATYDFTVTKRVVNIPGEVLVTDLDGNSQEGVTVYALNEAMTSELAQAVTDANGIASGMDFTSTAQLVNIYAEKDGKYSYTVPTRTLTALLTSDPTYIRSGTTVDPTKSKTITWMSSPLASTGTAIMKLKKQTDEGDGAFVEYTGTTRILEFNATASSGVVKGSSVTVENLEPGTTYIYQVGDGTTWSPTREFTTTTVTDQFSFGAFGDLQASSNGEMSRWLAAATTMEAMPVKPLFSLNVGDITDNDSHYGYHSFYGYLFNERPVYANIDMIASYGNHEYMGSPTAENNFFLNGHPVIAPSAKYNAQLLGHSYAVEYGNALVISLDWEARGPASATAIMTEQAKWMDEVLSQTNKTWKIVTLHYPIFPSESTSGSQAIYGSVFDKHNVQLVFCGHGHVIERVQAKNGVVTSGTDRRTFQPVTGNGTVYFQIGDMTGTGSNGRWILCEVDGTKMTVTSRNGSNDVVANERFTLETTNVDYIESISTLNLNVYPNPFADELRITGAENSALRVMNIVGTVVHTQKITNSNEAIRLSQLPTGMYFFHVEKGGQTKTVKVVKK